MTVIIVSLILIFIGNSLPLGGVLMGVTLPFITFIIGKRRNLFFIFLAWILFSLQTDKYSFNLLVMSLFGFLNFLLFCYIEYLVVNIVSFFIFNYFYTSRKNKRKIDET